MSKSEVNPPELAEAINAKGFTGAAGFRIVAVEPGCAELALARRDDRVQFFGHFHGGVITALADQAAGVAVTSGLPKGRIGVTVEIKVNFLSPADGSELIARAKTLKMSDRRRHRRSLLAERSHGDPLRLLYRDHAGAGPAGRVPVMAGRREPERPYKIAA